MASGLAHLGVSRIHGKNIKFSMHALSNPISFVVAHLYPIFLCSLVVEIYRVVFLTGPPDFQYQNEKQVAANQDYFFKKISM